MKENKTKATDASVEAYLPAIEDPAARQDCSVVVQLMGKITGQPPVMWGPTIVGFGSYHYRYASGREGDACIAGFASRKPNICIYLLADSDSQQALLAKLGKHRMTKACLYIRRLSDIDIKVLEKLIATSVAEVERRHGGTSRRSA